MTQKNSGMTARTVREDKNNFDFPEGNTQFDAGTEYEVNYKAAQTWSEYVDNLVTFTSGRARFFHNKMYVESTCGHDYVAVITKPTCTEAGYTTYTCTSAATAIRTMRFLPWDTILWTASAPAAGPPP